MQCRQSVADFAVPLNYMRMKLKKFILTLISAMMATSLLAAPAKGSKKDIDNEFVLVIDAGHGGKDIGAVDNGVREKDINLGVAKQLAAKVKKNLKNVKVVMTRDNDSFISLQQRADIANKNKGNLFISIHTNSVDKSNKNRKTVAGTSVYALGLHKDASNLQVARRENSVIELESNFEQKYSGFDPSKDESYIIFEMAQKKNLGQSLKFANLAQKQLVKTARRADRGVKQAGFWVLWATSMPSVLVELDFICNPNSAKYMGSAKGQEQLAEALFDAVKDYVDSYRRNGGVMTAEEVPATEHHEVPPTLIAVEPVEKKMDMTRQTTARRAASAKRKRRSGQARLESTKRNLETADIPLHGEEELLAVVDKSEMTVETSTEEANPQETTFAKDKKKRKKKDKKENEGKTVTKPAKHKSISGYHSKVEKLKTVYKIQILASDELLKQNNPRFQGLSPIKSFKESNLYKYTYGESANKKEMEKLLKEVKEKIPDAFIIKCFQ